jgi:hypothetical protein
MVPYVVGIGVGVLSWFAVVAEICNLRWDWELHVPELACSVFIIPGAFVKNGEERLVVLNRHARAVVDGERRQHPTHVFPLQGTTHRPHAELVVAESTRAGVEPRPRSRLEAHVRSPLFVRQA